MPDSYNNMFPTHLKLKYKSMQSSSSRHIPSFFYIYLTYTKIFIFLLQRSGYWQLVLKIRGMNQHFETCTHRVFISAGQQSEESSLWSCEKHVHMKLQVVSLLYWKLKHRGVVVNRLYTCFLVKVTFKAGADVRRCRTLALEQGEGETMTFNNNSNPTITAPVLTVSLLWTTTLLNQEAFRHYGNQSALSVDSGWRAFI